MLRFRWWGVSVLVAAAPVASAGIAPVRPLVGALSDQNILVEVDRITGQRREIGPFGGAPAITGLAYDPGSHVLYGSNTDNQLFRIDPSTGTATQIGSDNHPGMDGLAFDVRTGTLYGAINSHGHALFEIDVATGAATAVARFQGASDVKGLTFGANGVLYGVADTENRLVSIDVATGVATFVMGLSEGFWAAVEYDAVEEVFYATKAGALGGHNALYRLDPGGAGEQFIASTGDEIITAYNFMHGLAIIPSPASSWLCLAAAALCLRRRRDSRTHLPVGSLP